MPEEKTRKEQAQDVVSEGSLSDIVPEEEATMAEVASPQINPLIILPPMLIAAIMALALALVYDVTKEPIAAAKLKEKQDKLAKVLPGYNPETGTAGFDNNVIETETQLNDSVTLYTGKQGEDVIGYALTSEAPKSYSGGFSIVFGITPDGVIEKIEILTTAETPGLGTKADPEVTSQIAGKDPDEFNINVKKDGGDVDAISGATITSRAVCDAVNLGLEAFESRDVDSGGGTEPDAEEATNGS